MEMFGKEISKHIKQFTSIIAQKHLYTFKFVFTIVTKLLWFLHGEKLKTCSKYLH